MTRKAVCIAVYFASRLGILIILALIWQHPGKVYGVETLYLLLLVIPIIAGWICYPPGKRSNQVGFLNERTNQIGFVDPK